jgi:acyl-coenzyme A thioesterase PaaI-like protein
MAIKQPNSLHCFVCGVENSYGLKLKFYETAPGEVTVFHTVPPQFQGYPGIVHGGIVASMLDEALGRSHMGVDSQNSRFMFTAHLDIQYRKPVPVGQPLRIVGWSGKRKTRSATATAAIYAEDGEILAEATAVLVDVPEEMLAGSDLEALGWQVYPDEEETME